MIQRPSWVRFEDPQRLQFAWDDARGGAEDLGGQSLADQVLATALDIEPRARMALAIALTEWIVWRFDGFHDRNEPAEFLEAAWCGTADPRYLQFFELTRTEWLGPVEGPLWCAMTYLRHAIAVGLDFPRDLYEGLSYLTELAAYVQPTPGPLQNWLPPVLDRLRKSFPLTPDDPLADLFSRDPSSRMGPWVAREVFEPAASVGPDAGRLFLESVLASAVRDENFFLATPDELEDVQFSGTPYVLR